MHTSLKYMLELVSMVDMRKLELAMKSCLFTIFMYIYI